MSSTLTTDAPALALREFHPFEAFGARFLYMVPSAGIFRLDDVASAALDILASGPRARDQVVAQLRSRFGPARTVCLIHPDNTPSLRVAEKAGYRERVRTTYKDAPTILLERQP